MTTKESVTVRGLSSEATIGVFSPSEPIVESRVERFKRGLSILEGHGFGVKLSKNHLAKHGYMAGTIDERVDDIHDLVRDNEVDALIASWGGKSCNQLIKKLDYRLIAKAKKPMMGFSDVDVLLNAITAHTGLITFHGPNIVGKLDETKHSDLGLLTGKSQEGANLLGTSAQTLAQTIKEGSVSGRLFGGNLSTFVLSLFYVDVSPDFWDGKIFFWEEASMPPQLIDQYLTGLANCGLLGRIGGMIIGSFIQEDSVDWKRVDALQSLRTILSAYRYPILYCPNFGHSSLENPLLPIGAYCNLNTGAGTLQMLEHVLD